MTREAAAGSGSDSSGAVAPVGARRRLRLEVPYEKNAAGPLVRAGIPPHGVGTRPHGSLGNSRLGRRVRRSPSCWDQMRGPRALEAAAAQR